MPIDEARSQQMRQLGQSGARSKKVAAIERRIRELNSADAPLTADQRQRLVALLSPSAAA